MAAKSFPVFIVSTLKHLIWLGGRHWWLSFLLWIVLVGSAQALELRAAIKDDASQVKVGSSTPAVIRDGAGQKIGEIPEMNAFYAQTDGGGVALDQWRSGQLWIEPTGDGYVWIGDRWYRGRTHLVRNNSGVTAVNHVDLEDYLYSVVGAEAIPSWPLDTLKAQAVAARTYALYKRSESSNSLYDLDTTTATQVYKGLDSEYLSTHQAVDATEGQVMSYNGEVILAVFHASSGGHTEDVENVWSSPLPYLRGVIDYDQKSPVYQWTKTFSRSEMSRRIGGVGTIETMVSERRTPNGRVVTMKVVGDRGTKRVSGAQIRQALDLRSTLFAVAPKGDSFQVSGRGFGHGVGLSQWGAFGLAQRGANYRQILGHYYQGASLSEVE